MWFTQYYDRRRDQSMVFDATPHGAWVEIDTPVHGADLFQCPQFELHAAGAVTRHPVR